MRSSKTATIKDTLLDVMQGLTNRQVEARKSDDIEGVFKKSLTKKQRGHIKFKYFRKGIINASVDSSVWLYSLSLSKGDLLGKLNKSGRNVKDIRFRMGSIE